MKPGEVSLRHKDSHGIGIPGRLWVASLKLRGWLGWSLCPANTPEKRPLQLCLASPPHPSSSIRPHEKNSEFRA